jgi:5-oxopent-3-ene-1,2,5-tricarboxylate decarboxylase / 2-hydroxyhepta-2,4-diene-1,7-dioate isomerase
MSGYRRILLDGACVQVVRDGDELVAGDGRRVAAAEAPTHTIANDFGLHDFRDTDAGSMLRVKGSDMMAPLGPGLVTGWDYRGRHLRTYVNGAVVPHGSTDEMRWDMHYLVADIARTITLLPGDVLLSGTPANSRPVQPGDVVEAEVDGLGRLKNYIGAAPFGMPADYGAQPMVSEEVLSTALGGDWEFRGIRPPARS